MKIGYFDCFSGAAGDMIVAACIDAGVSVDSLRAELAKLNLPGVDIQIERVDRSGIGAVFFAPIVESQASGHHHHHRGLSDILAIIDRSELSPTVKTGASSIFRNLGRAEATIHNIDIEKVHFHEVGAVDAIVDIVGAAVALDLLGIERLYCSALAVGSGMVDCEHGRLPVPAPATAELIKGVPIRSTAIEAELLTPTGAAILTSLAESFGPMPAMRIDSIGYGAGSLQVPSMPNVLRLLIGSTIDGDADSPAEEVCVLETNIDDMSAELIGHLTELLLAVGALDVFTTSILMKKNRPASLVTVISRPSDVSKLERIIFRDSSTFGIRRYNCVRSTLARSWRTVETRYGPIRIKEGSLSGELMSSSPEFEDCRKAAGLHNVAVRDVISAALAAHSDSVEG